MRFPTGSWVVTEISVGGELTPPLEGSSLTLDVAGDRVSGSAGINRFMGQVDAHGLGPLATTMMAGPSDLMAQEQMYLAHLARVDAIEDSQSLIVLVGEGIILLMLAPAGERSGTSDH